MVAVRAFFHCSIWPKLCDVENPWMSNWIFIFSGNTMATVLLWTCISSAEARSAGELCLREPSIKSRYRFKRERWAFTNSHTMYCGHPTNWLYALTHVLCLTGGKMFNNTNLGSYIIAYFPLLGHKWSPNHKSWSGSTECCVQILISSAYAMLVYGPGQVLIAAVVIQIYEPFFWSSPLSSWPGAGLLYDMLMQLQKHIQCDAVRS